MTEQARQQSPFLTTKEAANYLRISVRTMENWRWSHDGPEYRKHGGTVVYHIDDLNDFSTVWNKSRKPHRGA
ncbi:MAG: hypothetical protein VR75_14265 [Hyphomonadaceae bacterium BRH_c29]|nr:MAG: hypothetical protein VR75_14265 [Hyphomonadaceae bacterium BRH_c29]